MMTFALNYGLKETRANGNLLQVYVADLTRDCILFARCLLNNSTGMFWKRASFILASVVSFLAADVCVNLFDDYHFPRTISSLVLFAATEASFLWANPEKQAYFFGAIGSMFMGWLLARFCDAFHLWCQMDVVTVYFLIGQWALIRLQWQFKRLPVISTTTYIYRGYLCLAMAAEAFIMHDIIFRYLPRCFSLAFFWIHAVLDL